MGLKALKLIESLENSQNVQAIMNVKVQNLTKIEVAAPMDAPAVFLQVLTVSLAVHVLIFLTSNSKGLKINVQNA